MTTAIHRIRALLCALLIVGAWTAPGRCENTKTPADSADVPGPRYFDTQDGFYLNVRHITRRSGTVTAMITLVTREEFVVCSNEIALDGRASDSALDLSIKGIYHPVPFFMDTRGPATGVYYQDAPPPRYQLRIAYGDTVDIWQVDTSDSGVVLQPIRTLFTESKPIWPQGTKTSGGDN